MNNFIRNKAIASSLHEIIGKTYHGDNANKIILLLIADLIVFIFEHLSQHLGDE